MGANAHHRGRFKATLSPRAVATFPASPPLAAASALVSQERLAGHCNSWPGRAVPKWTRYGWWDAEGTQLTVTRIL